MVFEQSQQEKTTMSTAAAMVTSRSKCVLRKTKWLKSRDGQYRLRDASMLQQTLKTS